MQRLQGKVVLVTGASSGIGRATALAFAEAGCHVAVGARRVERLTELAEEMRGKGVQVYAAYLDVTDPAAVERFVAGAVAELGRIDVLVNNAGLARGNHRVADPADDKLDAWREMLDTNVLGLLLVTERVLPLLVAQGSGHIINLGSVASHGVYAGGSVYTASKHAEKAITQALRLEVLGQGVRVTSVDPGMVESEFSIVRFRGDEAQAAKIYAGVEPLTPADIAECIVWAASRPHHVNIDQMIVKPTDQADFSKIHRRSQLKVSY